MDWSLPPCPYLPIPRQAQFILSPDQLFSEKGAISSIKYHDRFKKYKKFLVKNIETRGTKALMARLNAGLFQTYSSGNQPAPTSTGEQESDIEDYFSRAFQDEAIPSMLMFFFFPQSLTTCEAGSSTETPPIDSPPVPSISLSTRAESLVLDSDPNISVPTPLADLNGPPTISDGEDGVTAAANGWIKKTTSGGTKKGARGVKGATGSGVAKRMMGTRSKKNKP